MKLGPVGSENNSGTSKWKLLFGCKDSLRDPKVTNGVTYLYWVTRGLKRAYWWIIYTNI